MKKEIFEAANFEQLTTAMSAGMSLPTGRGVVAEIAYEGGQVIGETTSESADLTIVEPMTDFSAIEAAARNIVAGVRYVIEYREGRRRRRVRWVYQY